MTPFAVRVGPVVSIGSSESDGLEQFVGLAQIERARSKFFSPTQSVGSKVGEPRGINSFRRVKVLHDHVLVVTLEFQVFSLS